MKGQIFRIDIVPSSCSFHIRSLRVDDAAGKDPIAFPSEFVMNPEIHRPGRRAGDGLKLPDLLREDSRGRSRRGNRPPGCDDPVKVSSTLLRPGDQVDGERWVSDPDDEWKAPLPQNDPRLELIRARTMLILCADRDFGFIRYHPHPAPGKRDGPDS